MRRRWGIVVAAVGLVAACSATPESVTPSTSSSRTTTSVAPSSVGPSSVDPSSEVPSPPRTAPDGRPFVVEEIGELDEPWAMTFLPDGRSLITGRGGELTLRATDGQTTSVTGVPDVVAQGQGGLGDIIVAPDFDATRHVYLSWAEAGEGGSGAAVARATLTTDGDEASLDDLTRVWEQQPKVSGNGHYGHRLAFSPDGEHLFISSGERQKMQPAQDLDSHLGKLIRLDPDGSAADGNPFADRGEVAADVWSYGHRNPLGLAFDADGNLWNSEMGPQGGDELNLVTEGANYGWPEASNGSHYGGAEIPDHATGDGFTAPKASWNPSISPGSLMIYSGSMFPQWQGDAFLGALSGEALIRIDLDGTDAAEGDSWGLDRRIREVEQAPDGSIWLLTDEGQVLRLSAP